MQGCINSKIKMDTKLNDSISTTISEGLKYIQAISKHLPEDLTEKTQSVTSSFQNLLRVLDEAKRMCVPELNRNYVNRGNMHTSLSDEQVEPDYETLSPTDAKGIISNFSRVDERKRMNIPPNTTVHNYLEILEKDHCKAPTDPHAPRTRLNITVNSKLKGLYYCLIENGLLHLDRNINAEHSEYVISLSEYSIKTVNNFTIKFTNNELEIALLFCSKIDCNTWVNYLTAASDSLYSYVTIDRCNVPITPPPKAKLNSTASMPIRKSTSVDTLLRPDSEFIDLSSLSLEFATEVYERGLKYRLPNRNNVTAPLPITPTNDPSDSMENVTPNVGVKRFRRFLNRKQLKDASNNGRANEMPQTHLPYENIIIHSEPSYIKTIS